MIAAAVSGNAGRPSGTCQPSRAAAFDSVLSVTQDRGRHLGGSAWAGVDLGYKVINNMREVSGLDAAASVE